MGHTVDELAALAERIRELRNEFPLQIDPSIGEPQDELGAILRDVRARLDAAFHQTELAVGHLVLKKRRRPELPSDEIPA